jgi:hypothetical protein
LSVFKEEYSKNKKKGKRYMKMRNFRRNAQATELLVYSQLLREVILEEVDALQQQILETPGQTRNPLQALLMVYEQLSDGYKIAFLLAGGAAQLLQNQRERRGETFSEPITEDLPFLFFPQ